jgi:hypothetical protein
MNDRPLDVNVRELATDIQRFRTLCEQWWKYNAWRKNTLLITSILLVLGATVAGVWGHSYTAATFSAISGAIISAQNSFKFAEHTTFYGRAMTECDRLSRKLSYQTKTPADFDSVADAFDRLRNSEGEEGQKKP